MRNQKKLQNCMNIVYLYPRKKTEESKETMKPENEKEIIEFLYDIFQKKDEPSVSEPMPVPDGTNPLWKFSYIFFVWVGGFFVIQYFPALL